MTLQRLLLCWLLLGPSLIGMAGMASAAPVRPPAAGTSPVVARVHLCGGTGSLVRAGQTEFPAATGLPLLRTDELRVPPSEFLVVALDNGYLVRIDEDLTLRVSDIVLLGAPRTQKSLAEQLDRLVTREERAQAERLAGTQARRSAAESMPAQPQAPPPVATSSPRPATRTGAAPPRASRGLPAPTGAAPPPPPPPAPAPPPVTAGFPAPGAPGGYPLPGAPGGYPAPGVPGGYPAPGAPAGFPAPGAPGGYPAPGAPAGAPAPGSAPPSANTLDDDPVRGEASRPSPRPAPSAPRDDRAARAQAEAEARERALQEARARAEEESRAQVERARESQRARAEAEMARARAAAAGAKDKAPSKAPPPRAPVSSAPGDPLGGLEAPSAPPPAAPAAPPPPVEPPPPAPAASELPELPRLRQCLASELGRLPVAIRRVTVRVKVEGGQIQRVVLGGGLPTPACAREILLLQHIDLRADMKGVDGPWLTTEIALR